MTGDGEPSASGTEHLEPTVAGFADSPQFKAMVAKRLAEFGPGTPELNLFAQANQFHAAGHRSLCGVRNPSGGIELHLAPGVVCYAFASELYLKALHQIAAGRTPKGHKPNVLFWNLPVATHQIIEGLYQDLLGGAVKADLPGDLLNFNSAFEDWRYVHEMGNQQLRLGALIQFTISLYRTVRHKRPDWPMADLPPYLTMPSFMT